VKTCECGVDNRDEALYCDSCGRPLAVHVEHDEGASPPEGREVAPRTVLERRRILTIAATFVAVVIVLAIGLTYLLRNVHIEISSNNLVSVQLPLNVCKTSTGDASETPVKLPATIQVDLTKGSSTQLAFYSDNEGLVKVLAPGGWSCTAAIGADGSSSVTASPAGVPSQPSATQPPVTAAQEINASQTSACVGCRESLACPLFAAAAHDYLQQYQQQCPSRRPTSELVTTLNPNVVAFTDPPGVKGDGDPSGGHYAAMGVMTYYDDFHSGGSWTETCVLPPNEKSLCTSILGSFESEYGKQ
jgi:hypothetical protein